MACTRPARMYCTVQAARRKLGALEEEWRTQTPPATARAPAPRLALRVADEAATLQQVLPSPPSSPSALLPLPSPHSLPQPMTLPLPPPDPASTVTPPPAAIPKQELHELGDRATILMGAEVFRGGDAAEWHAAKVGEPLRRAKRLASDAARRAPQSPPSVCRSATV